MQQFHKNFNSAILQIMDNMELKTLKDVAEHIKIPYMTLWKIVEGKQKPTIQHCILVCKFGDFAGNWLFLNYGPKTKSDELSLNLIIKKLNDLKQPKK